MHLLSSLVLAALLALPIQDGKPVIRFTPPALTLRADSTGYVVGKVNFVNTGGGTLTVTSVNGSCGCATASVQRNNVQAMTMGELRLSINTHAFKDSVNNVDYTIASNAENAVVVFRVVVLKHPTAP